MKHAAVEFLWASSDVGMHVTRACGSMHTQTSSHTLMHIVAAPGGGRDCSWDSGWYSVSDRLYQDSDAGVHVCGHTQVKRVRVWTRPCARCLALALALALDLMHARTHRRTHARARTHPSTAHSQVFQCAVHTISPANQPRSDKKCPCPLLLSASHSTDSGGVHVCRFQRVCVVACVHVPLLVLVSVRSGIGVMIVLHVRVGG